MHKNVLLTNSLLYRCFPTIIDYLTILNTDRKPSMKEDVTVRMQMSRVYTAAMVSTKNSIRFRINVFVTLAFKSRYLRRCFSLSGKGYIQYLAKSCSRNMVLSVPICLAQAYTYSITIIAAILPAYYCWVSFISNFRKVEAFRFIASIFFPLCLHLHIFSFKA